MAVVAERQEADPRRDRHGRRLLELEHVAVELHAVAVGLGDLGRGELDGDVLPGVEAELESFVGSELVPVVGQRHDAPPTHVLASSTAATASLPQASAPANVDDGVRDGRAAEHDLDLAAEARLVDGGDGGLHRLEGDGEQAAEADHLGRCVSRTVSTTLATGTSTPEVDDVEPGDVEHGDHDVLADVVDVALHGAHHHGAELLARVVGLEIRLQLGGDALHDLAGHDELGDERLAVGEPLADDVHRLAAGRDDLERVGAALQFLVRDPQRVVLAQLDHGFLEPG